VSSEAEGLARLEAALAGAASVQAGRLRRRRRRGAVLAVVVAPLVLLAAGSLARTGTLSGVDHNLSTLRDDRLAAPAGAAGTLSGSLGVRSRTREDVRTWTVANRRVVGFVSRGGTFCYSFTGLSGGCLTKTALTPARPLNPATDRLVHGFRVYGLAADDVIGVTVRAHGVTRRATISHNTFYLQVDSPAIARGFTLTLLAHLRDGKTRRMSIPVADSDNPTRKTLPALPGALAPVEDTAA
jgi:hypothetical protein